jgi:Ni/Co efflux regulator RcnB
MRYHAIVSAVAAFSMSVSGLAFAQNDKDIRADRAGQGSYDVRLPRHADPRDRPVDTRRDDRRSDRRDDYRSRNDRRDDYRGRDDRRGPPGHAPAYGYRDGRGAGPNHNFYRGGRQPPEWRSRQYVVDDWRGHRLTAPPRGYHWVQTGGDYVLVAIATGIIASILLNQ